MTEPPGIDPTTGMRYAAGRDPLDQPTTVDEVPWGDPPPTDAHRQVAQPAPRKCSHPKSKRATTIDMPPRTICHPSMGGCGHVFDPAKVAQGRKNLRRGKDAERRVAKELDGRRTGQFGGADDVQALFAVQVKAGPTYWPRSLARLLEDQRLAAAALGKAGPAVAYVETGHTGRRNRVIVAVYADDLARALNARGTSSVKAGQATYTGSTEQENT